MEPERLQYTQVINQIEWLVVILLLNKQAIYFIAQLFSSVRLLTLFTPKG